MTIFKTNLSKALGWLGAIPATMFVIYLFGHINQFFLLLPIELLFSAYYLSKHGTQTKKYLLQIVSVIQITAAFSCLILNYLIATFD